MTAYSLADAQARLPELIDRVRRGEGVVITDRGQVVAELKPANDPAPLSLLPPKGPTDLSWLDAHRVTPSKPIAEDAGALVSRMRDESQH